MHSLIAPTIRHFSVNHVLNTISSTVFSIIPKLSYLHLLNPRPLGKPLFFISSLMYFICDYEIRCIYFLIMEYNSHLLHLNHFYSLSFFTLNYLFDYDKKGENLKGNIV